MVAYLRDVAPWTAAHDGNTSVVPRFAIICWHFFLLWFLIAPRAWLQNFLELAGALAEPRSAHSL